MENNNREQNSIHIYGTPDYRPHSFVSLGKACVSISLTSQTTMYFGSQEQLDALAGALKEAGQRLTEATNPFPAIVCECGESWTQESHTVCPRCATWPNRSTTAVADEHK